jgi:hypothetical protein
MEWDGTMRRLVYGWAAAGLLCLSGGANAAPLTATYEGVLLGTTTPFTATFSYDSDDLSQNVDDPTLFDGVGHTQSAVFTSAGSSYSFDSSDYFYERVISGVTPDYEFGIGQSDGAFLYLKLTGDVQEGNFGLAGGEDEPDLDPQSVTITPATTAVTPVPLPPAATLFAGALLALGIAGWVRPRSA